MIWKVVFWFGVLTGGWGLISTVTSISGNLTHDIGVVIGAIVTFLGFVSMYGFAYKVAIGSRILAIFTFVLNLSFLVYWLYIIQFWQYFVGDFGQIILTAIGLVFMSLFFYPIFGYAFRSKDIWSNA